MFVVKWFYGVLKYLGLYDKNAKILFLGLENAGKTTLLNVLKNNRVACHAPTVCPTCEELEVAGVHIKAYDLAGQEGMRRVWKDYFPCVYGVVFLVDSRDRDRFTEAKRLLDGLLTDDLLANVPFLILGNKVDAPGAASEQELRDSLGLDFSTGKGKLDVQSNPGIRPCELFMCSAVRCEGFGEGFRWLSQYIG